MIIDGVNFNEDAVRAMSYDEFEAQHIGILWQDRDTDTRKKILRQAYGLMTPKTAKRKTQKSEK